MAVPATGYALLGLAGRNSLCIPLPVPNDGISLKPFTVEHWLYLDSNDSTGGMLSNLVPGDGFNTGPLNLYIRSVAGEGYSFTGGGTNLRAGTPPVGQWFHVAWVFTGSQATIYENGALLASGNVSSIPVGCDWIHSEFNSGTADTPIDGKIARLRFWSKALTGNEVADAKDATYDDSEPGLIVQYELDESPAEVFAKPDRAYQYALLLNHDPANADDLVANRMSYVYPAPAYDRPKQTEVSGIITDSNGQPCQRKVYAVTRPTDGTAPEVVAHGLSDPATGEYTLGLPTTDEVSRVVVSEDDDSPLLNDLIDRIIPE